MSRWLTCDICGLRKPVGIMSAQAWREVNGEGTVARACPDCQQKHPDWKHQLERVAGSSG
jgi:hypothetical protein